MSKFAQCLGFNLADAFTGDIKLLANLFKGVISVHPDPKSHLQDFRFSWSKGVEHILSSALKS
jgi:hypothetical protein